MQETPPVSLETWQDAERSILEQTVARLTRDFVGRRALVEDLVAWAATEASPRPELQERQGLCLVGEPGTGKSVLFAEIFFALSSLGAGDTMRQVSRQSSKTRLVVLAVFVSSERKEGRWECCQHIYGLHGGEGDMACGA